MFGFFLSVYPQSFAKANDCPNRNVSFRQKLRRRIPMKKIAVLMLALVMCLSCVTAMADVSNVKLGVILLHDEDSTYDLNFINGVNEAVANLGLAEDQLIMVRNIPESNDCYEAALDLVDEGCNIIFANSFGHESFMIEAAKEAPEVQFCHATGTKAHTEGLSNYHNAFAAIYEGRYLAGIAAGMKLNEMKAAGQIKGAAPVMGYVG
ncbi:MAG: BMP family ABC transporter substrate-binding protein, partial [Clostridia bacterium]|nr:BMP family ABC transporter substrate-binding protein [Clostridia bacterium]